MSAHAAPAPGGLTLSIRGTPYPILLPKLSDPRLHLAAVITSLQVLGQVAFDFRVSIAQIVLSLATAAVLEVVIAFRTQRVLMWPASALITGNGVAFILRVPGTSHGDWWSLRGWWIYVAASAGSLLSKHVIKFRGTHIFNPSNIGLVVCFLALGSNRADPLDFWWGPMSAWMVVALLIIVGGGLAILSRLRLLWIAIGFWLSFAAGIALLAGTGHAMSARWHLGPITGGYFWWVLLTSPEVLVFLFFMITDPKTIPRGARARIAYAVAIGLLASLLIAPLRSEFASKVALLGALAIVTGVRPLLAFVPWQRLRPTRRRTVSVVLVATATYAGVLVAAGLPARPTTAAAADLPPGALPPITILPSPGVQSKLSLTTARTIAHALLADRTVHATAKDALRLHLEAGRGQAPPFAVAELGDRTYRLNQKGPYWTLASSGAPARVWKAAPAETLPGFRLVNVAPKVGIHFRQGAFRFGVSPDPRAELGGGVCWVDYNNDGWLDLFAVNSYADADLPDWETHGGFPHSSLFENVHGKFRDVTRASHTGVTIRGNGCVAGDLNGDGYPDIYVTGSEYDVLLWNNGNGTFTEGAVSSGIDSYSWHSGAAIADVNGDGRPDLFVAGYTDVNQPIQGSAAGFPNSDAGIRDELFLNEGNNKKGRAIFKNVAAQVGLDPPPYDHSLGAVFYDFNGDGRPDLYVVNDGDPNKLYLNEPGGKYGFHFVERGAADGVADRNAGMGVAVGDYNGDGLPDLFVTNSRGETHATFESRGASFVDGRHPFLKALGTNGTGWGDTWADLSNDGRLDLVIANGAIPVTNIKNDAGPLQVLAQKPDGSFVQVHIPFSERLNGRGVAAADYDNDGRIDLAVGSIDAPLVLLRNTATDVGHWLEVNVKPFSPGATVTVVGDDGQRQVSEVQAGSSYLSTEDPRVHFGLGNAETVRELTVHYPNGVVRTLHDLRDDRIVDVTR